MPLIIDFLTLGRQTFQQKKVLQRNILEVRNELFEVEENVSCHNKYSRTQHMNFWPNAFDEKKLDW